MNFRLLKIYKLAGPGIERQYPELVGGLGVYRATRARGPFIHVDVRGDRARWGRF